MQTALALQTDFWPAATREDASSRDLVAQLKAFTFNGAPTIVEHWNGVPFLYNEFWTARQRQAHRIHEVSYRACFKPQLPAFFIDRLTRRGDRVYDPFMGRGTTPIEAAILGRHPVGNDVNPLSAFLVRPRLHAPSDMDVERRLREIDWAWHGPMREDLLVFYHPTTLGQIHALRQWFADRETAGTFDAVDDWIRMVAINRLTGHSPGFFSVYTLPPNQAVSIDAQTKINAKRDQTPPVRSVPAIILKKSRSLLGDAPFRAAESQLCTGPSDATPDIGAASVDLVVTSPPFLDVVQYAQDNWLRCWFADVDMSNVAIAMHKKVEDWQAFVRSTFTELARVVRPGGHVAFEVGEVRNGKVQLEKVVLDAITGLPFEPLAVVVNVQEFTKTANCWGVGNNVAGTNTNRIVVARRL
ncbi:DNA methyltransferase [Brevundimonas sp.]|uniref:DNA methyltransferase n=1 Tax=Brevundimonas sp. TaxID=1871086 RepID=UPI0026112C56|nr:DNA methyltransferase [Brevundimonas sp.]